MITAVHTLIYAEDAESARAFFRDVRAKGAEFEGSVEQEPWGMTVRLKVPGAGTLTLYEPTYDPPATSL